MCYVVNIPVVDVMGDVTIVVGDVVGVIVVGAVVVGVDVGAVVVTTVVGGAVVVVAVVDTVLKIIMYTCSMLAIASVLKF